MIRLAEVEVHRRGAADRPVPPGSGTGLLGLQERVALANGVLVHGPDPTGGFVVEEELDLFKDESMGSSTVDIKKQFATLKFGQPSLLKLQNGEVLAACWSFENSQYVIKGYRIAL